MTHIIDEHVKAMKKYNQNEVSWVYHCEYNDKGYVAFLHLLCSNAKRSKTIHDFCEI